jgi:hypothetical protein
MILVSILFFLLVSFEKLAILGIGIPSVIGFKHLLVALIVFLISFRKELKVDYRILLLVLLLLMYLLISSYFSETRPTSFFISFLFMMYPISILILGRSLHVSRGFVNRLIYRFVLIAIVCAVPALFFQLLGFDLRLNSWMYREAGALGSAMVITVIFCIYLLKENHISNRKFMYLVTIPIFIVLASVLKKNIIMLFFVMFTLYYFERHRFSKQQIRLLSVALVAGILIMTPVILVNIQKNIDYFVNVGADGHIRIVMFLTAININFDTNGLGSGLGSFGSLGSLVSSIGGSGVVYELSDIYYQYGIDQIAGNSADKLNQGEAGTLLDTFWPHIIGELGIIGSLLYLSIIGRVLSFRSSDYLPSLAIISVYFDGLFLIIPESPLFIFYSFFLASLALGAKRA